MFIASYISVLLVYGNLATPRVYGWCANTTTQEVFHPNHAFRYITIIVWFTIIWHVVLKRLIHLKELSLRTTNNSLMTNIVNHWWMLLILIFIGTLSVLRFIRPDGGKVYFNTVRVFLNIAVGWGLPIWSVCKNRHLRQYFKNRFTNHVIVV